MKFAIDMGKQVCYHVIVPKGTITQGGASPMTVEATGRIYLLPATLKRLGYKGYNFTINTEWSNKLILAFDSTPSPVSITFIANRFVYDHTGEADLVRDLIEITRDGYFYIREYEE